VDWAKSERTLVLVLRKGCDFCSESAPFYQKLVQETVEQKSARLVAVLPDEISEDRAYLHELGVAIAEIKQSSPQSIGVPGTPSLLLVNSEGFVIDSWIGKLSAKQESEVVDRLRGIGGNRVTNVDNKNSIEVPELRRLIAAKQIVVLLDIRDREEYVQGHIPEAINIPYDELEIRDLNELRRTDLIVPYGRWSDIELSEEASKILKRDGFHHTLALRGGLDAWQ